MNASTTYTHFLIASLKRFRPVPALLAVLLLCGAAAFAQLDTGSISGVVTDPAGRIVQGAAITATSAATGTTYSTVSSNTGYYVMPSVRTGTYVVKITSTGFKTAVYNNVTVSIGASTSRDVTLAVGAVDENVTVTAGTVSLEKDTSEIDATITPVQEAELPLQVTGSLRSITSLEFLVPGTVGPGTSSGGSGFQMTKINGGQEEGTDYLVDGITTNRQENGSGSVDILTPSPDAINEFHISLSGLPAELGRTTGGIANYNTKGGTNEYHGTVFDIYKNAAFDGNNWFNNGYLSQTTDPTARAELQRPPDTKNNYGLTLGGPVRIPHLYNGRDRTFFFFDWEQLHYATGAAPTSTIPTPAELGSNGNYFDFTSTLGGQIPGASDGCNSALYYGEIFDPTTETTANGPACRTPLTYNGNLNEIPIGRESQVAKAVLQYLPKPNLTSGTANYVYATHDTLDQTVYSFRIDQNIGANHKVWGFWSSRENTDQGGGAESARAVDLIRRRAQRPAWQTAPPRLGLDPIAHADQLADLWLQPLQQHHHGGRVLSQLRLGSEAGHRQRQRAGVSGIRLQRKPVSGLRRERRIAGRGQYARSERHCALAAWRAQHQVRRRRAVSPVLVRQQDRRHLQRHLGLLHLLG